MKRLIISIVAAMVLLVALLPSAVMAVGPGSGSSSGAFTVGRVSPTIANVKVYDSTGTTEVSSMNPQTQYMFKVEVTDLNSLDHLTTMRVILFYYSGTPSWPGPAVPISTNAAAGQADVVLPSAAGFAVGDNVQIKDTVHSEYKIVSAINANTLTLTTNLTYAYTTADRATITDFTDLPTVANSQTCANFNWVRSTNTWTSTYPPAAGDTGTTTWSSGIFTKPTDFSQNNFVFTGQFTPGKVATAGNWYIRVRVSDDQNYDGRGNTNAITMNPYDEIVVSTGNLDWGSVSPGLALTDPPNPLTLTIKYIANGNYSKYVSSSNWQGGTYLALLDSNGSATTRNHFALQSVIGANPPQFVRVVDGTYVYGTLMDNTGTITYEAGDNPASTMALKLAPAFDPDTYLGIMTYYIITR